MPDRRHIEDRNDWSSMSKSSQIRHVGLRWVSQEACWSLMGLPGGMLVSDETCWYLMTCWSPMRHCGLQWDMLVSNETCWSPMRHVGLQWGMSVYQLDMTVSNETCRSTNDVSDQIYRSPTGLWFPLLIKDLLYASTISCNHQRSPQFIKNILYSSKTFLFIKDLLYSSKTSSFHERPSLFMKDLLFLWKTSSINPNPPLFIKDLLFS